MTTPASPAVPPGPGGHAAQRYGHVTDRARTTTSGRDGYQVRDDETGMTYKFSGEDLVTEGFRAARAGEQVRFLIDRARPGHATYVIRLDLPDIEEHYL